MNSMNSCIGSLAWDADFYVRARCAMRKVRVRRPAGRPNVPDVPCAAAGRQAPGGRAAQPRRAHQGRLGRASHGDVRRASVWHIAPVPHSTPGAPPVSPAGAGSPDDILVGRRIRTVGTHVARFNFYILDRTHIGIPGEKLNETVETARGERALSPSRRVGRAGRSECAR